VEAQELAYSTAAWFRDRLWFGKPTSPSDYPDLPVVSMGRRNISLIRGGCDGAWLSEVVSRG
jgi:hypothetical protein